MVCLLCFVLLGVCCVLLYIVCLLDLFASFDYLLVLVVVCFVCYAGLVGWSACRFLVVDCMNACMVLLVFGIA